MLLNGRTGREEKSPIHVADVVRMKELSRRLGESRSTAAVDSGGDRAVELKASSQLGASNGVQRLAGGKRAGFDLREDLRVSEDSDLPAKKWKRADPRIASYPGILASTCPAAL